MPYIATVVVSLILGMAGLTQADARDASKTPGALVGKWTIESSSGQKLRDLGQQGTIEFTDKTYIVTMNGQVTERGNYKLDVKTKPTNIDMTITQGVAAGATQIGIVQVVDDTLTLKTNTVGTPLRATDFKPQVWYPLIIAKKTR